MGWRRGSASMSSPIRAGAACPRRTTRPVPEAPGWTRGPWWAGVIDHEPEKNGPAGPPFAGVDVGHTSGGRP